MRVSVGKSTFRFSRFGRSSGFGGRIRLISTRFTVYFGMRSGPQESAPSGPGGAQGALGGRVFAGSGPIPADCYRLGGASRAPGQPDPLHLTHCSPSGKILPRGAPGGCGPIGSELGGRIRCIYACFAVHIGVPWAPQIHLLGPGWGVRGMRGRRRGRQAPSPDRNSPRSTNADIHTCIDAYAHRRTVGASRRVNGTDVRKCARHARKGWPPLRNQASLRLLHCCVI